jgi:DNA mismatch repair ATPase MutL
MSQDVAHGNIKVEDNGTGISAEDMQKIGDRHCTSKIKDYQDYLDGLETLGYRGEALALLSGLCLQLRIASRQVSFLVVLGL